MAKAAVEDDELIAAGALAALQGRGGASTATINRRKVEYIRRTGKQLVAWAFLAELTQKTSNGKLWLPPTRTALERALDKHPDFVFLLEPFTEEQFVSTLLSMLPGGKDGSFAAEVKLNRSWRRQAKLYLNADPIGDYLFTEVSQEAVVASGRQLVTVPATYRMNTGEPPSPAIARHIDCSGHSLVAFDGRSRSSADGLSVSLRYAGSG